MIEKILYDYLVENMDCTVTFEECSEDEYVLIQKTGSGKSNYVSTATFALQSYSDSLYNAALLNDSVKEAMEDFVSETNISKVSLNSDYEYSDTTKKQYRYQAIFDITYNE